MDPTGILYAAFLAKGAQKAHDDEKKREEDRKKSDEDWKKFHDDMDKTFKRGRHSER